MIQPPPRGDERASLTDWIACFAGALGALLVSLDISITNASLPQIQGEIGANGTEATWISTGYLISEVVMIPLTGWLTRVFGMRSLLVSCASLFVMFSIVCGLSHDLTTMVVGRIGQGLVGGALIPTAQTIIRQRLPPRQLSFGMTMFSLIILVGPLGGPNLGGWLTENVSWRWCFFINLPVGVGLVTLLLVGLPHARAHFHLLRTADWGGILGMTIGLSCLTTLLEEGQRARWFDSDLICWLAGLSVAGFLVFGVAQRVVRDPVIKLRLLLNPGYLGVIVIVMSIGVVMYSVLYVLPQFLGGISGYNSQQAGRVMFLSGIPTLCMVPILPRLVQRADLRVMVGCGVVLAALGNLMSYHLTGDSDGGSFLWPQLVRGFGQTLCNIPLSQASIGAVAWEDTADAAGIYNMARNLGGSFGLASLGIFIDRRTELHADRIRESVQANAPLVQSRVDQSAAGFMQQGTDPAHAHMQALQLLAGQIHRQAMVMTYSECFAVFGILLLLCLPLVLLLRRPPAGTVVEAAH